MAISLVDLPTSVLEHFLVIAVILGYSILFGFLRYVLFLFILHKYSYLFMAPMFIAFDPPIDIAYIMGIYAFYISITSKRIKKSLEVWECG